MEHHLPEEGGPAQLAQEDHRGPVHHAIEGQPCRERSEPGWKEDQGQVGAREKLRDGQAEHNDRASFDHPEGREVHQNTIDHAGYSAQGQAEQESQPDGPAGSRFYRKDQQAGQVGRQAAKDKEVDDPAQFTTAPVAEEIAGLTQIRDDLPCADREHQVNPG